MLKATLQEVAPSPCPLSNLYPYVVAKNRSRLVRNTIISGIICSKREKMLQIWIGKAKQTVDQTQTKNNTDKNRTGKSQQGHCKFP